MAKEYHRVTSETIPVPSDNRPKMERQPPRSHYSTESGEWDGQLSHAELVHSATPDYPNYPGPVARRQWATKVGIAFNLSAGERSVPPSLRPRLRHAQRMLESRSHDRI